jgi:type II secretory pathway pseudopilin PulG
MKIPNSNNMISCINRTKGITLIELTVVILVLLTLISVLFIGAQAYKKGAERASCILNIRNVQQAVRSDQNIKEKNAGDSGLVETEIYDLAGLVYLTEPHCPSGANYTFQPDGKYPPVGTIALRCDLEVSKNHIPKSIAGW